MIKKFFSLYHYFWALGSALFYRLPSRNLIVIGVTGTTGKSTTVEMIGAVLEKAGYRVALSSSIRFKIADKIETNLMKQTMPGRGYLQGFLRQALDSGCRYAVIEVSSEGIKQYRQRFINFDVGVIINLAPEHIESHGGFENYKKAKLAFLKQIASSRKKVIEEKEIGKFIIANSEISQIEEFAGDKVANLSFDSKINPEVRLKLAGDFWHLNANAALAVAQSQGVARDAAAGALGGIEQMPGRMEEIKEGQNFKVFVDYAHTPGALESVYKFLSSEVKGSKLKNFQTSKLVCVLGAAGGGRDKWKRAEFGKLAWQYCDEIILTDEDPYDEDPDSIIDQIAFGIPSSKSYRRLLDRSGAIKSAVNLAGAGDVIVITGKGCEPWLMIEGGKKIPWDDREVVREALSRKSF